MMKLLVIPPIDQRAQEEAKRRLDDLTKPQGSLGRLEELAWKIAGMRGQSHPQVRRKAIFTVAADHGVVAEGVSLYPQAVTAQMVLNFLQGGAAINVLGRHVGAEVIVVDAGVVGNPFDKLRANGGRDGWLRVVKFRPGTGNMAKELAMSRVEAERIIQAGIDLVEEENRKDAIDLIGLGDMGIGNTTASSALTAVFTGRPLAEITGRGTGLTDEMWQRKVQVLEKALSLHRPNPDDPIDVLSKVGGLEIGCLAGIALAAAGRRIPVVLDGFIASAAALVAYRMKPNVRDFFLASHRSVEPGHAAILQALELEPLLDLQMRLGEGTGAALAIFLMEASLKLLSEMSTFSQARVSARLES